MDCHSVIARAKFDLEIYALRGYHGSCIEDIKCIYASNRVVVDWKIGARSPGYLVSVVTDESISPHSIELIGA